MISQKTKTLHHDLGAVVLSLAFRCGSVRVQDFLRLLMISFVPRSLSFTLNKIDVKLTSFDCANQRNCILIEKNIRFGKG